MILREHLSSRGTADMLSREDMEERSEDNSQIPDKWEQNGLIIEEVRIHEPILPAGLYKLVVPKLISHSALYRRWPRLVATGYLKQLPDGRLVTRDYQEIEEKITMI